MYKYLAFYWEVVTIIIYFTGLANPVSSSPCGDWTPYKNEKCIKFVITTGFQTKEDAESICKTFAEELHGEDIPKLIIVNTEEKQTFLQKLLFEEIETLDTVWLGLDLKEDGVFRWNDGTDLFFTNWAEEIGKTNPVDHERKCVQMESGEGVYPVGKWVKANCKKKNAVICERTQTWTMSDLQNIVLGLKLEVKINNEEMEAKINDTKKEAEQHIKQVENEARGKLDEADKKIIEAKLETQAKLNEAKEMINEARREADAKINEVKTISEQRLNQQMNAANQVVTNLKQNPVPVGFIYVQLPSQSPPTTLWPQVSWQDISSQYSGLFFRTEGGAAAPFGQEQQDNTRRLIGVFNYDGFDVQAIDPFPDDGNWSPRLFSGHNVGPGVGRRFRFSTGEIRPRNKAVKIWQRIK